MKTHKKKSIIIAGIVLACLLTVGGGLGIWVGVIVGDVYFANREDNLILASKKKNQGQQSLEVKPNTTHNSQTKIKKNKRHSTECLFLLV